MKASLIIIILLMLNTSVLLSEPLSAFVAGINTWVFVLIELMLGIGYWVNSIFKDVARTFEIELNDIGFYPKNTEE